MRKGILFMLLCLISVVAVACGGGNNAAGGGNGGGACSGGDGCNGGGGEEADDAMAFYKSAGNFYVMKTVTKMGDNETVSGMKVEVTASDDKGYTTKTTILNADLEPMAGMEPTETTVEWPKEGGEATDDGEAPAIEYEDVEVAGETLKCMKIVTGDTTSWSHKGMPVKSQTKTDQMETSSEVVEFKLD